MGAYISVYSNNPKRFYKISVGSLIFLTRPSTIIVKHLTYMDFITSILVIVIFDLCSYLLNHFFFQIGNDGCQAVH